MPSKSSSANNSNKSAATSAKQNKQVPAAAAAVDIEKLAKVADALKINEAATAIVGAGPVGGNGTKTPPEQPEFIKQALVLIEKKVRNLDKRRIKLDEYKEMLRKKTPLNEDQSSALSRYDEVIRTLELTKEMEKAFIQLANDAMKQQKKQAKRDQMEREESETTTVKTKLKDAQKYLVILKAFGETTVRNDFFKEKHGALRLKQDELNLLEEFGKLVSPTLINNGSKFETEIVESVEHLLALVDAKSKPIPGIKKPSTYADLHKLFDKVHKSAYWTKKEEKEVPVAVETPAATSAEVHSEKSSPVKHQQMEHQPQQQHQTVSPQRTQTYTNPENAHDADYVLVTAHDVAEHHQDEDTSATSKPESNDFQQHEQQTHNKAPFFTTLTQSANVNEFINKNDEDSLNFLQDSEVPRQLQHQDENQREGQFRTRGGRGGNYHGNNKPRYNNNNNNGPMDNRGPRGMQGGGAPRQHNGPSDGSHYNGQRDRDGQYNSGGSGGRGGYRGPSNNNSNNPRGGSNNSGGYNNSNNYRGGNSSNGPRRPQPSQGGQGHQQQQNNNNYQQQAPRANHQEQAQQAQTA